MASLLVGVAIVEDADFDSELVLSLSEKEENKESGPLLYSWWVLSGRGILFSRAIR